MIIRKTEEYYTEKFKIYTHDKDKQGHRRMKKVTYWFLFIPIISIKTVIEQTVFRVRF